LCLQFFYAADHIKKQGGGLHRQMDGWMDVTYCVLFRALVILSDVWRTSLSVWSQTWN